MVEVCWRPIQLYITVPSYITTDGTYIPIKEFKQFYVRFSSFCWRLFVFPSPFSTVFLLKYRFFSPDSISFRRPKKKKKSSCKPTTRLSLIWRGSSERIYSTGKSLDLSTLQRIKVPVTTLQNCNQQILSSPSMCILDEKCFCVKTFALFSIFQLNIVIYLFVCLYFVKFLCIIVKKTNRFVLSRKNLSLLL